MKLERPPRRVENQVAAEQAVLRVLDDGEKPYSRLRLSVRRANQPPFSSLFLHYSHIPYCNSVKLTVSRGIG
jgi:hypothetical protein